MNVKFPGLIVVGNMAYVQTKGWGGVSRVYLHPAGCKVTKKNYIYNLKGIIMDTRSKDVTMERKRILSEINLDTGIFMTSFDKAARLLMEQKEELEAQGWTSVHLKMEYYYDYAELKAYGMRLENDAEFSKRKEAEEKKLKAAERKAERSLKKRK